VTRLLLDQRQQQQLEVAMTEHAATATPAATAHVVPAAEEIAAAAMPAERATTGVAFLAMAVVTAVPIETEAEMAVVVALMHGMEEVVQTHGEDPVSLECV
jgi:hypothetical protein